MSKRETEENLNFTPKFDEKGLIPCITSCAKTGDVLMFAFMNAEALDKTIETGEAHYWSRSRKSLWHKGATSGHIQKVTEMRTDCDQDCIWIKIETDTGSCHTGRKSCFYRRISGDLNAKMLFIDAEMIFNPDDVYKA
ncbi:MAG: phosphoribosyl-AMP cyclohydrolase [Zetaproteobacteria bacterium]|nr:MAG: phosphoribosyl-AMP cyclohydrolase [Zetaproteobacteria bacterium]